MKTYKIPQVWQSWGVTEVKANSLEEAVKKAGLGPLPKQHEYIDDSQQFDWEGMTIHNDKLSEKDIKFLDSKTTITLKEVS